MRNSGRSGGTEMTKLPSDAAAVRCTYFQFLGTHAPNQRRKPPRTARFSPFHPSAVAVSGASISGLPVRIVTVASPGRGPPPFRMSRPRTRSVRVRSGLAVTAVLDAGASAEAGHSSGAGGLGTSPGGLASGSIPRVTAETLGDGPARSPRPRSRPAARRPSAPAANAKRARRDMRPSCRWRRLPPFLPSTLLGFEADGDLQGNALLHDHRHALLAVAGRGHQERPVAGREKRAASAHSPSLQHPNDRREVDDDLPISVLEPQDRLRWSRTALDDQPHVDLGPAFELNRKLRLLSPGDGPLRAPPDLPGIEGQDVGEVAAGGNTYEQELTAVRRGGELVTDPVEDAGAADRT